MNNKMTISNYLELVDKITGSYALICKPVIDEFNLQKIDFDIIMFLTNNPDYYTAKDISKMKKIKPNVVSLHVDKLVGSGYLERQIIEGDRRKIRLVCTDKASDIIKKGHIAQHKFYQALNVGLTDADRDAFKHYLDILVNNANNVEKEIMENGKVEK